MRYGSPINSLLKTSLSYTFETIEEETETIFCEGTMDRIYAIERLFGLGLPKENRKVATYPVNVGT